MDNLHIDTHKLIFHPARILQWQEAGDDWHLAKSIYPLYMELSPFGGCNHRCRFCALDFVGYKARSLKIEMLRQRLPEIGKLGIKSIMFGGEGEPLLHPDINEMITLASQADIDTALTSNGVKLHLDFLEKSLPLLRWIKISLNAGTANTYSQIHGCAPADFETVIHNLKQAVQLKQATAADCTLGAQILLLPETMAELPTLATICRDEIGLDYLVVKPFSQNPLSVSHCYEDINYQHLLHLADEMSSFSTPEFRLIFRAQTMARHDSQKTYKHCYATPNFWAYLMTNGDIYSCSAYLTDDRFRLGNLYEQSFQDIWEGPKRQENFHLMRQHFDPGNCRPNCRMDAINHYLWQLANPHPHVNFI